MRYDLIIFDFDGALADSAAWFVAALDGLADRHGFRKVGPEELEALRGLPNREVLRRLRIPVWKLPALARDARALAAQAAADIPLYAGIAPSLQALSQAGARLAVVSSNSEATVRAVLGPDLATLVQHYGCGASMFGKAAKMRQVLRATGLPADRAVAVGDEPRDVEAAHKAGLHSAVALWGYARREAFAGLTPALTFESPDEMRRALIA